MRKLYEPWCLFALWGIYAITYGVLNIYGKTQAIAGLLSMIAEAGLDLACCILALTLAKKLVNHEKIIFKLVASSFIFAAISDSSYNIILNIFGIRSFSFFIESIFDLPFTAFLLLQTIVWGLIFKVLFQKNNQNFNKLIFLPFLLSGVIIFLTFLLLPSWEVSPLSAEGLYNILDTTLEVISFGFVVIILFSAKGRSLALLASGYLIIIASDFIIRFAEVENVLFPGSALETTWALGLLIFLFGLINIKNSNQFNIKNSLNNWNSLHVQAGYWIFTSSLFSILLLLVLNYFFSNIDVKGVRDIPATLIVFAVFTSIASHLISSYLIRPFKYLKKLVSLYAQSDLALPPERSTETKIEEFKQLENCLYDGLTAIKNRSYIERNYFNSVVEYTNKIRGPASAIHMLVNDIVELPPGKKQLLLDAANQINITTEHLIKKINLIPNENKEANFPHIDGKNSDLVIMIDDNINLSMAWEMAAEENGVSIKTYNNPNDFMTDAGMFDKSIKIYIDINLINEINGIELSRWAYKEGFENLYLITGDRSGDFPEMPWIKEILGKMPPF